MYIVITVFTFIFCILFIIGVVYQKHFNKKYNSKENIQMYYSKKSLSSCYSENNFLKYELGRKENENGTNINDIKFTDVDLNSIFLKSECGK